MKFKEEYKAALDSVPDKETSERIMQNVLRETKKKRSPIKIAAISVAGTAAAAVLIAVVIPKIARMKSSNDMATGTAESISAPASGIAGGAVSTPNSEVTAEDMENAVVEEGAEIAVGNDGFNAGNTAGDSGYDDYYGDIEETDKGVAAPDYALKEPLSIEFDKDGSCILTDSDGTVTEYSSSETVSHFSELPETETAVDSDDNYYEIYRDGNFLYVFDENMESAYCYMIPGTSVTEDSAAGASPSFPGE